MKTTITIENRDGSNNTVVKKNGLAETYTFVKTLHAEDVKNVYVAYHGKSYSRNFNVNHLLIKGEVEND